MRIGAGLSREPDAHVALGHALAQVTTQLPGQDEGRLVVLFVSPHHQHEFAGLSRRIWDALDPSTTMGAVVQGVIGPGTEAEDGPAVAVWACDFEGVGWSSPFRSWTLPGPDGSTTIAGLPDTRPGDVMLLLADPLSYPAGQVIARLDEDRTGHVVLGGLVTGGPGAGGLMLDGQVHDGGAVGMVFRRAPVEVVVSQGCRPVGDPYVVTAADHNVLLELGGVPATDRLRAIFAAAGDEDRQLLQQGLHLGIVADEYRDDFGTGDFLIRAVLGADEDRGGVLVGDVVEVGRVVQFQVRDAASAHDDLADRLGRLQHGSSSAGALLFTCNGRGERFFGRPHHDVQAVEERVGPAIAGAFCAGEIGPVGARSYVHGFTASLLVFGDPPRA